jgi:hypothetical protein
VKSDRHVVADSSDGPRAALKRGNLGIATDASASDHLTPQTAARLREHLSLIDSLGFFLA